MNTKFHRRKLLTSVVASVLFLSVSACSGQSGPDEQQIMSDLLGKTVKISALNTWRFSRLSEFESLKVVNEMSTGNAVEYQAEIMLKEGGSRYKMIAIINYAERGGKWQLVSVISDSFSRR